MSTGIIKCFNNQKGFGLIEQNDGTTVFVHRIEINGYNERTVIEGDRVCFEVVHLSSGYAARNVTVT
jgi:CspA family cold shock protein